MHFVEFCGAFCEKEYSIELPKIILCHKVCELIFMEDVD